MSARPTFFFTPVPGCCEDGGKTTTTGSGLNVEAQRENIRAAVNIFDRLGVPFKGFRAPYLRTDNCTVDAVEETGRFIYDSSTTVLWDEVYESGCR